jgi:hypothetical protein
VRHAVPGIDEASVTLMTGEVPHIATATSRVVEKLDDDQDPIGDGPCLKAARRGKIVRAAVSSTRLR